MKKRGFRPQKLQPPSYPPLGEVDRGAVKRWGLVGLLMTGAACKPAQADLPPPGEPPLQRVENKADAKAAAPPDAGAPRAPEPPPMGGAPEPQRIERGGPEPAGGEKAKGADKKNKTGDKKGKSGAAGKTDGRGDKTVVKPPTRPPRPGHGGKMMAPRSDEKDSW
jgi:hypothetical protein